MEGAGGSSAGDPGSADPEIPGAFRDAWPGSGPGIEQISRGTFRVKPGSLFPALHRMEQAGWLRASWGESENGRRAKYYRLSSAGRRQLRTETREWGRISLAIASVLKAT